MRDEDKSKEQLLQELRELRRQIKGEAGQDSPSVAQTQPAGPDAGKEPETQKIRVSGIDMEWSPQHGTCTFEKLPAAMMWVDTTLAGLMSGLQAMVGTTRFLLALQSEGRKSVEADWQVISQFPDFPAGFQAIANIAAVAGWGAWELLSLDEEKKECRFRVADSWEGLYQKALGVTWGSGMLAGKLAGYCSKLFETNCWADQTQFIAGGDAFDEFVVHPSSKSIEQEIENLLAADAATRADMAVALRKLEKGINERLQVEAELEQSVSLLQATLESTADGLLVTDGSGKIVAYNRKLAQMWRLPESVMASGKFDQAEAFVLEQLKEPERCVSKVQELFAQPEAESFDLIEFKDGRVFERYSQPQRLGETIVGRVWSFRDVTQRQRAEKALQESEEKYRTLMETANDAIFIADADTGMILDANHKAQELLGRPLEEIRGMHQSELHPPEENERYRQIFQAHLQVGGLISKDISVVDSQGHHIPVEISASATEVRGRKLIHGIFRNLTERRRAEEALRRSEEKYRLLVNQIPAVVFKGYRDWSVDFFDGKVEALTGYKKAEFDSRRLKWSEIVLPEDLDYATRIFKEALKTDGAFVREHRIRRKDGDIRWIQCRGQIIFDAGGKIDHVSGVTFDITPRKQAEESLAEEVTWRRILLEQSLDGIAVLDQTGKVYEANQRYAEMLGYSAEEIRQLYVWDWDAQWTREELVEIIHGADGTGDHFETRHRRKDGTIFDAEISANGAIVGGQKLIFCVCRDISQRKAAERALRESEEKYRLLVNQIPAVVFKGHPDWSVDFFDNKIETLTGYSKEEFDSRRKKWSEMILEEDVHEVKRRSREAVKTGSRSYAREYRIRKIDGGIAWVQAMGQIFYDAAGKLDYVSGVFFDITERKRAEEALLKYEFIANTAKDCMTLIDRHYVYQAANTAYCHAQGKTMEEVVGATVSNMWGADTFNKAIKDFLDRCFNGEAVEFEGRFEFGKQGLGCYHVFYNPYVNAQGEVIYAAVVSHDVTERKRIEDALRQSEVKYRQLVDQIPAVVYRGYADWSVECFDQKIEEITGYSMEEFNSRRITARDLIFPEDFPAAEALFAEALKEDGSYVFEHRIRRKTGEVRWIQARNKIIFNDAGKPEYISGVFFDITERKELEDQLIKAQRMEAIGILAGGLAHDFNNLLTAIIGYSEIMMMDLRKEDPFCMFVEEITKAANRGGSLTNQLLAFSRKQILQPRVLNLNEVVVDLEKMLRRLIGEDIELLTAVDPELGSVKGDPGQIEQIIMNLAVNARDAMPDGGKLTIETADVFLDEAYARSHVGVTPGPYAMLAVSDNGQGMDAETMARIFEPFYTTKESSKGTGLGLATVYGIVKQSGGHIWVYSESGRGTTFKVYLPRVEEDREEVRIKIAPATTLKGTETILLVEDDAALRELISTALRRYGFTVLEAAHGGEALLICEGHQSPIHLLLTDVVMPQISGTALAERLKPFHPELKVLFMSGYTENAIVHHGVLDSQVNFIPKPFRVLALIQKVREVLDSMEEEAPRH